MPDLSAELGLALALGGDDTRDYLRGASPSLRSSLQIIDGLFNQTTGHTHNGAHQGGALSFQDLIVGGNLTVVGQTTLQQSLQCNTSLTVTGPSTLNGGATTTTLHATGAGTFDTTLNVGTTLTVSGAASIASALTIGGNLGVQGGIVYFEPSNQVLIQWRSDLGALYIPYGNGIYVGGGTSTFAGNLQVNGSLAANARITANADILIGPNSTAAVLYLGSDGSVYFQRYEDGSIGRVIHAIAPNGILAQGFCPEGGNGFFAHSDRPGAPGNEVKAESHLFVRGSVWCTNVQQISAEALKSNIVNLPPTEALSLVLDARVDPFRYQLDTPPPAGGGQMQPTNFGFGAAAMSQVCPEVVALGTVNGVDDQPMAIDYPSLVPVLWGALRALDARLSALEGV